jgi:hypothetical protein
LTHRLDFWKKKALRTTKAITEYPIGVVASCDGGDDRTVLRCIATPLELALVGCCERLPPESCEFTPVKPLHRSRLHRPICPSNYDADSEERDNGDKADIPDVTVEENTSSQQPTLHKCGILLREKECHFLSLLCMHCTANALGHRALALAILQRTVDWEASTSKSTDEVPPHVIGHFLEAGGMKLLARWLVDSFTVAPTSKGRVASPTGSLLLPIIQLLRSIPFNKDIVVASHIHKIIKRLRKAIDALVEGLDPSQLKHKHPITGGLSVGIVLAALNELMSDWKQAAAAQMQPGSEKRPDVKSQPSPFDALQKELELRFKNLTTLQNEGGEPPEWLPKSISSIISGKSHLLAMHANSFKSTVSSHSEGSTALETPPTQQSDICSARATNTNWYEPTKKEPSAERTRTWERLVSKKRKGHVTIGGKSPTQIQKLNSERSRRVSWADRPLIRSALQAPLAEVRVFVKDVLDESDAIHRHNNAHDNNQIEPSPNVKAKEESVDDRELEDLCDDPDLADMF